jgi:hypothetical protein
VDFSAPYHNDQYHIVVKTYFYTCVLDQTMAAAAALADDMTVQPGSRALGLDMWVWALLCRIEAGEYELDEWRPRIDTALREARRLGGWRVRSNVRHTEFLYRSLVRPPARARRAATRELNAWTARDGGLWRLELMLCWMRAAARSGRKLPRAERLYEFFVQRFPLHARLPAIRRELDAAREKKATRHLRPAAVASAETIVAEVTAAADELRSPELRSP